MKVLGMKEGGTLLTDIGMSIPVGKVVDIPHNLSRRSTDLQTALDAGDVKPAPSAEAKSKAANPPRPRRASGGTRPPPTKPTPVNVLQLLAEMRGEIDALKDRLTKAEGEIDALKAKTKKATAKKFPAKTKAKPKAEPKAKAVKKTKTKKTTKKK